MVITEYTINTAKEKGSSRIEIVPLALGLGFSITGITQSQGYDRLKCSVAENVLWQRADTST
jgi:hypothetical protein